jgi:hypothetical protein
LGLSVNKCSGENLPRRNRNIEICFEARSVAKKIGEKVDIPHIEQLIVKPELTIPKQLSKGDSFTLR